MASAYELGHDTYSDRSDWRGGVSPFGTSWQKTMMWFFIVSDALLFGAFLAAYGFKRLAAGTWPDRTHVFHMSYITVMTFVLITSSATMASAVAAASASRKQAASRFLLLTMLGGAGFLGMQAYEWSSVIREGARLHANPWGVPDFSSFFFVITGFHGTHVLIGVIVLAATLFRNATGRVSREGVELCGLYWHFVDLVWVFIFGLFYLV
ncbi:MAG: cytochrome c oxidase subunit 3 [Acidobacteriota bacterium]